MAIKAQLCNEGLEYSTYKYFIQNDVNIIWYYRPICFLLLFELLEDTDILKVMKKTYFCCMSYIILFTSLSKIIF